MTDKSTDTPSHDYKDTLNLADTPFAMRANLAHALGVDVENVGVAATTTEKLGWEGQGEGIGAWAVCLLQKTVKE